MIDNRARTRLSDANHLALNICELVKLIEFRGMWRAVVTWGQFSKYSAAFMVPLYGGLSIIKTASLQSFHSAMNSYCISDQGQFDLFNMHVQRVYSVW